MTMRKLFMVVSGVLLGMSVVAWLWRTDDDAGGKTRLVWVSDPNPMRIRQVELFNDLNPDLSLKLDPDNSGTMKVIVQSSAGMGPDLIGQVTFDRTMGLYLDAGVLMDLTEVAPKYGFSYATLPEQVQRLCYVRVYDAETNTLKRGQFGYPANNANSFVIFNKTIFDRYGVPYPNSDMTWEQFVEVTKRVTIKEGDAPAIFGFDGNVFKELLQIYDTDVINEDGTRSLVASEAFIKAATEYHKLYFRHKVCPTRDDRSNMTSQGGWEGSSGPALMAQGRVAMIGGARWMLIGLRRYHDYQTSQRKKFLEAHPDRADEAPVVMAYGACLMPRDIHGVNVSMTGARQVCVNAKTKNQEAAFRFMQYLASEPYADMINEGADAKPGPARFHELDRFVSDAYPGETEIHRMSLEAVKYGRIAHSSLLVGSAVITRTVDQVRQRLEAQPLTDAEIERMCQRYSAELDQSIAREIQRDLTKKKIYRLLLAEGAEPIRGDDK
ncbi:MAG: extracellular solute-binding protein [Lentisphaeria bacterium]|nr:extracellular solute-binding protein [Lentisphaeria bacterium]